MVRIAAPFSILTILCLTSYTPTATADWFSSSSNDNDDVGTLQLLQIVHTHGDRTPSHFVNDDPFIDQTRYWPEGVGQLTKLGRSQVYRIGQTLNENYAAFIDKHLRKNILEKVLEAQSSATRRCLESTTVMVQALMGELTSSNQIDFNDTSMGSPEYQTLSKFWRPIPVRSRVPKTSNEVLDSSIECPNLQEEIRRLRRESFDVRKLWRDNAEFISDISHYSGEPLTEFENLYELVHELTFEQARNLSWSSFKIWTKEYEDQVTARLTKIVEDYLDILYSNRKIQTLSVGPLLQTLSGNIRHFLENQTGPRIFVYGTHDSKIATLLKALDLLEDDDSRTITGGASLVFELRQRKDQFFVRTFHVSEPTSASKNFSNFERFPESYCYPELPMINHPILRCPVANYLAYSYPMEPFDWEYQCGLKKRIVNLFTASIALLAANLGCLLVLMITLKIYSSQIRYSQLTMNNLPSSSTS